MHTLKALEEIGNCRNYDLALMTTFNLDVDFFERYIVGTLYSNDIKKIALFVDAREFNKEISNTWKKSLLMGSRYSVNPVRITGAFHPKVLLLLSQDRAKVIIGSANFTQSGYSTNNEIFDVFEYDSDHTEFLPIIIATAEFFKKVYKKSYALDKQIMDELDSIFYLKQRIPANKDIFLLHSLDRPIAEQLIEIIDKPSAVDIAVPFYDNNLDAVSGIIDVYPDASINTYVQNHKSRFNVSKAVKTESIAVKAFTGFKTPDSNSFYHGKVLRFVADDCSWILYGSANCTGAALYGTPINGGNIECCILERGEKGEFDYFFDNMCLQDTEDICCDLLTFTSDDTNEKYYFLYGRVIESSAELHIGVIGTFNSPTISLCGNELSSSYDLETKTITVNVAITDISSDSDIFTITLSDSTGVYEVKCWLYNESVLKLNRTSEGKIVFEYKYDPEAVGDDQLEDIMNMMKIIAIYRDDKVRNSEVIKTVEQAKDATEDYEDAPEGIVDYVIPPRMPTADELKQYDNIIAAREGGRCRIASYYPRSSGTTHSKQHEITTSKGKRRQPSQTELRIKDFIKSAVKELLKDSSLEITNAEDFLIHTINILWTMNKYTDDVVQGMYSLKQNVEIRLMLLAGLLKIKDGFTDDIVITLFRLVIETHYLNKRLNKSKGLANYSEKPIYDLFMGIEDRFHVREDVDSIITAEFTEDIGDNLEGIIFSGEGAGKVGGIRPSSGQMKHYIYRDVYGYMTKKEVYEQIHNRFGENCIIDTENGSFKVSLYDKLKDYFRAEGIRELMADVDNYCKHYHVPVKEIVFEINGVSIPATSDPAIRICFSKAVDAGGITSTVYYKVREPDVETLW